jgi:hypothetical protein
MCFSSTIFHLPTHCPPLGHSHTKSRQLCGVLIPRAKLAARLASALIAEAPWLCVTTFRRFCSEQLRSKAQRTVDLVARPVCDSGEI